jgi:hypothetical protein
VLFLAVERCAHALLSQLTDLDALDALPDDAARALRTAAAGELQRAMDARRQLRTIAGLAAGRGWRVAVLKSALPAARGSAVIADLADIDLLAPDPDAELLADELGRLGYEVTGVQQPQHLAPQAEPGALAVEIHRSLERDGSAVPSAVLRSLEPIAAMPGLLRLSPADYAWHVLVHGIVAHPNRSGSLKDLLLLRDALGECSATQRGEVERRIAAHPESTRLGQALVIGDALLRYRPVTDVFADVAAANYLLASAASHPRLRHLVSWPFALSVFALLGERGERAQQWRRIWEDRRPSPHPSLARLEQAAPALGRAARVVLRVARYAVARTAAIASRAIAHAITSRR